MSYWEEHLGEYNPRQPPMAIIIGDIGEGKTATMASIADEYSNKYGLTPYMIGTKNELEHFPSNWKRIDPTNLKVPKNAILCGDDLHKYYHARDWADGEVRNLETIARERGHTQTMVLITTQVSRVIDVNLLNITSCLIIKKPSLMMAKYDRGELQTLIRKADSALQPEQPERAYILSNVSRYEGTIDDIPLPSWWKDESSTLHKDSVNYEPPTIDSVSKPIYTGLRILKAIGQATR